MKWLTLLLFPAALFSGQARYARLGEFAGKVEVQLRAADGWMPAERNLVLPELAWVRTGPASRVEIELDDGGAWRLGPDSQGELSDYARLSTGQRVTLLSLDHGLAYFTGEPAGKDVLMLVAPGAQVTLTHGARVRVAAQATWSLISVIEGTVRFSSPAAELDLREGQSTRVEPANATRFFLYPEIAAMPLDGWSEERDKVQASPPSAAHVMERYGVVDLDAGGEWIQTDDLGTVWKPKVAEGWAPFQRGRWRWYSTLGYTWVSDETWGWLPYHYGRWTRKDKVGWVWAPSVSEVFKPGEVYWLAGAKLAGWGPLAPGERWTPTEPDAAAPQQFANAYTTYAAFQQDAPVIDPAGFAARPAEPLLEAAFRAALPSPAFAAWQLDATRPALRAGSTRVTPVVKGVTFQDTTDTAAPAGEPRPVVVITDPPVDAAPPQPPPPPDGIYPPGVTDVIVVNPPEHPDYSHLPRPLPPRPSAAHAPAPPATPAPNREARGTPASDYPQGVNSTPPPAPAPGPAPRNRPGEDHTAAPPAGPLPAPRERPAAAPAPAPVAPPATGPAPAPRERPAPTPAPTPTPATTAPPAVIPRVEPSIKVEKSDVTPAKKNDKAQMQAVKRPRDQGESELYNAVLRDAGTDSLRAIQELDLWMRRYPNSDFRDDRTYFYVLAYHGAHQPGKVLEAAGKLLSGDLGTALGDPTRVLQVLLPAAVNIQKLRDPTAEQLATGERAARQLLDLLPSYFAAEKKPAGTSDAMWAMARGQIESVGKAALRQVAASGVADVRR